MCHFQSDLLISLEFGQSLHQGMPRQACFVPSMSARVDLVFILERIEKARDSYYCIVLIGAFVSILPNLLKAPQS